MQVVLNSHISGYVASSDKLYCGKRASIETLVYWLAFRGLTLAEFKCGYTIPEIASLLSKHNEAEIEKLTETFTDDQKKEFETLVLELDEIAKHLVEKSNADKTMQ